MTPTLFEFSVLAFTSLFTMVNPLGTAPVYASMTSGLPPAETRRIARKATLTATLIMALFALTGQFIFQFFSISANSFKIVGGVIFFTIGYEMLQARLSRTKHAEESLPEYGNDIAITPLAIPMICGPGAITTVVLLMNESRGPEYVAVLFGAIVVIAALTYLVLVSAQNILRRLGDSGNKVMLRLMGLIVMVIAVEFFVSGLREIVREILMLT